MEAAKGPEPLREPYMPRKSDIFREVKMKSHCELLNVTPEEVTEAKKNWHHHRICDHTLVEDEDCYPYSLRSCAVCGKSLGLV
jgi:hypothetical protein